MTEAKTAAPPPAVIHGIKGFDLDMKCRGMQFEVGKTYTHDGPVVPCKSGFHAIPDDQHPLAVFDFYAPGQSRFARVELSGETAREDEKIAAQILTVGKEIGFADLVQSAVDFVTAHATEKGEHVTGNQGAASSTGNQGAASSTGYRGAASSTGYQGAASSTGDQGAASSTGNQGAASSTGDQGAASSTGNQGAASSTGYRGAASSTGKHSNAMVTGYYGRVMGADGCGLYAVERGPNGENASNACGIVGRDGIAAGVWYCCKDGKLVEVAQ